MKTIMYSKEDKQFFSRPYISKKEYEEKIKRSREQAERGEIAFTLSTPEDFENFKKWMEG